MATGTYKCDRCGKLGTEHDDVACSGPSWSYASRLEKVNADLAAERDALTKRCLELQERCQRLESAALKEPR